MGTERVPWHRRPVIRSLSYALTGGVILVLVNAAFNIKDLKGPGLLAYLASAFVGLLIGWIYDLGTRMNETTNKSIQQMRRLSEILDWQDQPLRLLVNARKHSPTIGVLLKASIGEQYRTIASVDSNRYLSLLRQALKSSDRFNGIMRKTVSWFRENNDGATYLQELSSRRMSEKIRVFIIDTAGVKTMQEEMADEGLMTFYWQHTGSVDTYWITEREMRDNYPELGMPDDCALFDRELLIKYDERRQTVFFDIVDERSVERQLFERLHTQIQNGSDRPFKRVRRQRGAVRTPPSPAERTG